MATNSTGLTCGRLVLPLLASGWLLAACPCAARDPATISEAEQPINLAMFHDPQLEVAKAKVTYPQGLKGLWLDAMRRPESELRRLAADSFALGHQRGMRDLEDTHTHLAELLKSPDEDVAVQRAAVHALIELDAREYADLLAATAAARGLTISLLVEPALARWKSTAMHAAWLARLEDPSTGRAARLLAIRGLGETGATQAVPVLTRIVTTSHLKAGERVAAAQALSKLQPPGQLVELAGTLRESASRPAVLAPILALELMAHDDSPAAIVLLGELATHGETAVQGRALERLYAIDPQHVFRFAGTAITSNDVNVRTVGARAMIVQKKAELIEPLASLLDDVNPTLRHDVAMALVRLAAEPGLHGEVIQHAATVLSRDGWRGLEQATIVLVLLDHKPAGHRLVELLKHPRGEVRIASAWGLRKLALPEHLPAMLAQAQGTYDVFLTGEFALSEPGVEMQVTQLFLAFGQMHYEEAEALLLKYVPKDHSLGTFSRAAAVWSLGHLHEGRATADLTDKLVARIADTLSLDPENEFVRRMSAVSVGRMKSVSAADRLRQLAAGDGGYTKVALYWAIEQLTGDPPPPLDPLFVSFNDWFLIPAD